MINYKDQLKLQAFLDGELPEQETRAMAARLATDAEMVALHQELRQTRQAVKGNESPVTLPESREFYWSKIQREIQRLDKPTPAPASASAGIGRWLRLLIPAAAAGLVVLFALFRTGTAPAPDSVFETALADSKAFTYRDYSGGSTLVWLSYPAENDVADDDDMGTLD